VLRSALLAFVVGVVSCGKGDPPAAGSGEGTIPGLSPADSAAIMAADSAFATAVNGGDIEGIVSVYAIDAALLPPNLPLHRGRAAVRRYWGGLLDAYTVKFEIASDIIEGRGDLAYNLGHYRFTAVPKAKSAPGTADEGKFVEILKRQPDGSWKYVVDIFNSNLAPPR
jgi:ketosteroid isomerase-like protein